VAEKRKFAALTELHRAQPEPEVTEATPAAPPPAASYDAGKGRGRPATGKRSNPEWKLFSHFLKKRTQRAAVARLQAEESERDLSDVLEELLENWLKA